MPVVGEIRVPGCLVVAAALLFMGLPLAELALLVYAAVEIGFWWTVGACVATGIAGSVIAKWQGTVTLRRAQQSLASGAFPADQILDGACVLVGGVLLLTPGFLSDAMGFTLLLPPTRALVKAGLRRWWRARSGVIDVEPVE